MQDVTLVRVIGNPQQLEGGRWRNVRACDLTLREADASLALLLVQKQRYLLGRDLDINIWGVDVDLKSGPGAKDLVADISGKTNWGVVGKLWIELKVFSVGIFEREVKKEKKKSKK